VCCVLQMSEDDNADVVTDFNMFEDDNADRCQHVYMCCYVLLCSTEAFRLQWRCDGLQTVMLL